MDIDHQVSSKWVAHHLSGVSASTIAADIGILIRKGEIPENALLPGVRPLAKLLGVSPSTVSSAWAELKRYGLIEGMGRGGVRVLGPPPTPFPIRYKEDDHYGQPFKFDLGFSVPDITLLPDIRAALLNSGQWKFNDYQRDRIVPALESAARRSWPFKPQELQATDGGYDGLRLAIHTFVNPGDWVIVDQVTTPRSLDIVEVSGARMKFLERDNEGVTPASLAEAIALRPVALVLQPGIHVPLGSSMSARRARDLAELLKESSILVIETDEQNALFDEPIFSLSELMPDKHLYIRSYSKSHGPDLRTAVMEGPEDLISKVHSYYAFGAGWTSRILQEALAWMLDDSATQALVHEAAEKYRQKSAMLTRALRARGVSTPEAAGLEIVVNVRDEEFARGYLKASGIAVQSGKQFTNGDRLPWLRISISPITSANVDEIAIRIAEAAQ
ncbi:MULTISPECIES: aminotransferase-like domain-containing protein [Brevibacterium]|uniref:PLP-dependent aminotransferase family protein n=1 Tax=Brevibacterium aurantiacum TaxID=273384 RepID=A0A4Z0KGR9_BREAU|nr:MULTISPECIES: PLP-dependent aminotransferase family protein [Brevibacterium]TGD37852.1 PLP-dependent aminotransferase family protein [Brevibacterium aurantiacum]SMX79736.1 DNA-binding transcriptional regulator, MocR family, contains an aminotransferase domain [Brevibacterium sp. 239c]